VTARLGHFCATSNRCCAEAILELPYLVGVGATKRKEQVLESTQRVPELRQHCPLADCRAASLPADTFERTSPQTTSTSSSCAAAAGARRLATPPAPPAWTAGTSGRSP
jgi:hypothetical protein